MKVKFKNKTYPGFDALLKQEYKGKKIKILSKGESNTKINKSLKAYVDYDVMLVHLLPHNEADTLMQRKTKRTVCAFATVAECHIACLNKAGRGGIIKKGEDTNAIQVARLRRTLLYLDDRDTFMAQLYKEVALFVKRCKKNNKKPCVRLNGTSDIQWELELYKGKSMFDSFPGVQWYDYTKIPTRKVDHISNYHLTWSYSEASEKYSKLFDTVPNNKAVVFRNKELPSTFKGVKVIDGDKTDMRFLDEPNVVVGLKAKGKAKKDMTGFVIDN
jgi:hypothetical protein